MKPLYVLLGSLCLIMAMEQDNDIDVVLNLISDLKDNAQQEIKLLDDQWKSTNARKHDTINTLSTLVQQQRGECSNRDQDVANKEQDISITLNFINWLEKRISDNTNRLGLLDSLRCRSNSNFIGDAKNNRRTLSIVQFLRKAIQNSAEKDLPELLQQTQFKHHLNKFIKSQNNIAILLQIKQEEEDHDQVEGKSENDDQSDGKQVKENSENDDADGKAISIPDIEEYETITTESAPEVLYPTTAREAHKQSQEAHRQSQEAQKQSQEDQDQNLPDTNQQTEPDNNQEGDGVSENDDSSDGNTIRTHIHENQHYEVSYETKKGKTITTDAAPEVEYPTSAKEAQILNLPINEEPEVEYEQSQNDDSSDGNTIRTHVHEHDHYEVSYENRKGKTITTEGPPEMEYPTSAKEAHILNLPVNQEPDVEYEPSQNDDASDSSDGQTIRTHIHENQHYEVKYENKNGKTRRTHRAPDQEYPTTAKEASNQNLPVTTLEPENEDEKSQNDDDSDTIRTHIHENQHYEVTYENRKGKTITTDGAPDVEYPTTAKEAENLNLPVSNQNDQSEGEISGGQNQEGDDQELNGLTQGDDNKASEHNEVVESEDASQGQQDDVHTTTKQPDQSEGDDNEASENRSELDGLTYTTTKHLVQSEGDDNEASEHNEVVQSEDASQGQHDDVHTTTKQPDQSEGDDNEASENSSELDGVTYTTTKHLVQSEGGDNEASEHNEVVESEDASQGQHDAVHQSEGDDNEASEHTQVNANVEDSDNQDTQDSDDVVSERFTTTKQQQDDNEVQQDAQALSTVVSQEASPRSQDSKSYSVVQKQLLDLLDSIEAEVRGTNTKFQDNQVISAMGYNDFSDVILSENLALGLHGVSENENLQRLNNQLITVVKTQKECKKVLQNLKTVLTYADEDQQGAEQNYNIVRETLSNEIDLFGDVYRVYSNQVANQSQDYKRNVQKKIQG